MKTQRVSETNCSDVIKFKGKIEAIIGKEVSFDEALTFVLRKLKRCEESYSERCESGEDWMTSLIFKEMYPDVFKPKVEVLEKSRNEEEVKRK